jgi:hypothetical protein
LITFSCGPDSSTLFRNVRASPVSCATSIKSLFKGAQLAKTNFQYEKRQKELEKKKKKEEKLKRKLEKGTSAEVESAEVESDEAVKPEEPGSDAPAPDAPQQP